MREWSTFMDGAGSEMDQLEEENRRLRRENKRLSREAHAAWDSAKNNAKQLAKLERDNEALRQDLEKHVAILLDRQQ